MSARRFDGEHRELASWMLSRIREHTPNFKGPPNLDAWGNELRIRSRKTAHRNDENARAFSTGCMGTPITSGERTF